MSALITWLFTWIFLVDRAMREVERADRSALHEYEYILETKQLRVQECHREKRVHKEAAAKRWKPEQQVVMQQKPTEKDEEAELELQSTEKEEEPEPLFVTLSQCYFDLALRLSEVTALYKWDYILLAPPTTPAAADPDFS
jgi:DNA-directed RNA polymerase subunit M/transcription elongation factor TFIIS